MCHMAFPTFTLKNPNMVPMHSIDGSWSIPLATPRPCHACSASVGGVCGSKPTAVTGTATWSHGPMGGGKMPGRSFRSFRYLTAFSQAEVIQFAAVISTIPRVLFSGRSIDTQFGDSKFSFGSPGRGPRVRLLDSWWTGFGSGKQKQTN